MTPEQIQKMAEGFPPSSIGKDHEEVIVWLAEQHVALQEQVEKLAVENQLLNEFITVACEVVDGKSLGDVYLPAEDFKPETPATDAVIREIGAKAVDGFGIYHNFSDKLFIQQEAQKYAAKLLAGEVS